MITKNRPKIKLSTAQFLLSSIRLLLEKIYIYKHIYMYIKLIVIFYSRWVHINTTSFYWWYGIPERNYPFTLNWITIIACIKLLYYTPRNRKAIGYSTFSLILPNTFFSEAWYNSLKCSTVFNMHSLWWV